MDNFFPFTSPNANSVQEFSMDVNNNHSHFTTIPTYDHHQAQPHHLLPPYSYPVEQMPVVMNPQPLYSVVGFPQIPVTQTGSEFNPLVINPNPYLSQERGEFPDPTKLARINRRLAMIRSRNNSSPNSSPIELVDSRRQMMLDMKDNVQTPDNKDLYPYCTFDNKKLRVLCVKHLKNSDVGELGRIVLPKREAEENLPKLSEKKGIIVVMRDVFSLQSWSFKYKFWVNNKSRMYILENKEEFMKQSGVEMGDILTIYEDESKNLYLAITKTGKQNGGSSGNESTEMNEQKPYKEIMNDYTPRDEDEASLAMLIRSLSGDYPNPSVFMDLTVDLQHQQATSSLPFMDQPHGGFIR